MDEYMTVAEVAKTLRVSQATIRRAIAAEELEVYRIGAQPRIRISSEQLRAYIERHRSTTNNASATLTQRETVEPARTPQSKDSKQASYSGTLSNGASWQVINADVNAGLAALESGTVNCIVTSPPYYWQRDYEVSGQIGHEKTIEEYVTALRDVFRQAQRVLRDDGVVFLNIGDTYYSAKGKPHGKDSKHRARQLSRTMLRAVDGPGLGVPRKSLLGIPWRVALAMQADGWVLRSSIVWQRPAPMPEPTAHDRPWRTHELVFLFAKEPRYWFNRDALEGEEDVWQISAHSRNPGAHFAPYPVEFADRCVAAGCPIGGTVLDPFVGSGSTMVAALRRGMNAIGIDLKLEYCEYVRQQVAQLKIPPKGMKGTTSLAQLA